MSLHSLRFTMEEPKRELDIKKHSGVWEKVQNIQDKLVHLEGLLQHGGDEKQRQVVRNLLKIYMSLMNLMRYYKATILDELSKYKNSSEVINTLFQCYLLYENALYRKQEADPMIVDILQGFDEARKRSFQELFEDVKDVYDRYYKINKHFPPRNNHH